MSVKSTVASHACQGGGPVAVCPAESASARRAAGPLRPYGALPHDLTADPRLSPTDVRVAAALLFWARSKAVCWPSDRSIAARIGRSVGTVQRSLRNLARAGWIGRAKTAANRTGRLITIAWRSTTDARPLPSSVTEAPPSLARDEGELREGDTHNRGPVAAESLPDQFPIEDPPSPPVQEALADLRPDSAEALASRLATEGLPEALAQRFALETPDASERMLLNLEILRTSGRLQNPAGYLRAGIEARYSLLPAAAKRVEATQRAEQTAMRNAQAALAKAQADAQQEAEERLVDHTLAAMSPERLGELVRQAVATLPPPLLRRDRSIGNPFVRAKVVELAGISLEVANSRELST